MPPEPIRCGRCRSELPPAIFNAPDFTPCPKCGSPTEVRVFPAYHQPAGKFAAALALDDDREASCFFHPRKSAVAACDQCGRFLCGLCETPLDGRTLCPSCLSQKKAGATPVIGGETLLYDRIALLIGFWPLLLVFTLWIVWPVYLITAAVTLFFVVRHWRRPRQSVTPNSRFRLVIAAFCALLQLGVAAGFAAWMSSSHSFAHFLTHFRFK